MDKEYKFKIPEGKHMLRLSRERSIDARLKNFANWEKENLKVTYNRVNEEKE